MRKALGMSQDALAKACGLSQTTISDIERDRNETSRDAPAIARALGVATDWLAEGIGDPNPMRTLTIPANTEPGPDIRGRVPPTVAEMLEALRADTAGLPPEVQKLMAEMIAGYLASPADEAAHRLPLIETLLKSGKR